MCLIIKPVEILPHSATTEHVSRYYSSISIFSLLYEAALSDNDAILRQCANTVIKAFIRTEHCYSKCAESPVLRQTADSRVFADQPGNK